MRMAAAVTGARGVPVGLTVLTVVYVGLAVVLAWILGRLARAPLGGPDTTVGVPPEVGHVAG
jgi:hypothetical protein